MYHENLNNNPSLNIKILLLGKNGQLGWELQRSLAPLGEVLALDRNSTSYCGDLYKFERLEETVHIYRPNFIVNAAAYTAVDKAESEPELARKLNADAPKVLAGAAKKIGAWLIHYSTDYVFDGLGSDARDEFQKTEPLNIYGQTKLDGENAIIASGCKYLIFRTSWIYSTRGENFAKTILRLAQERLELKVINDQYGAPTGADLIADTTAHVLQRVRDAEHAGLSGVYHLAASGETTWHRYASHIIKQAKIIKPELPWLVKDVIAVPSNSYQTAAVRPKNSRLCTDKLRQTFGLTLPMWQLGVDRMLTEIL